MCTTCAFETSKALASTGGAAVLPAVAAAALTRIGFSRAERLLQQRTPASRAPRAIKLASALLVPAVLIVVLQL